MWYVKNKQFDRDLKDSGLDDEDMKVVLDDVFEGRAIPLGSKMYKIRGAMEGRGKAVDLEVYSFGRGKSL